MSRSIDIQISAATSDDVLRDENGAPYLLNLPVGEYAIVDPELILDSEPFKNWKNLADLYEDLHFGPGGDLYSARVNGYPVSGITTYLGEGEYSNDHGEVASTRSGILAAVPTDLLEELVVEYRHAPIVNVKIDSMITYGGSLQTIYFGREASFYTGYLENE